MRRFKTLTCLVISIMITMQNINTIQGATDSGILADEVSNVYTGREVGSNIISNLQFSDVGPSHWAKEAITRLGALDIVKGATGGRFLPGGSATKEEAITLMMRTIGLEEEAVLASQRIEAQNPSNTGLMSIWAKGYLQIARNQGLITNEEYNEAITIPLEGEEFTPTFVRQSPVSREQAAKWIVQAINSIQPELLAPNYTHQAIFNYMDWRTMGNEYTPYIEAVIRKQIMVGSNDRFNPKGNLSRAELAQVMKNLDEILYESMNIEQKGGIIGDVSDSNSLNPLSGNTIRSFLVRNDAGEVDQLHFEYKKTSNDLISTLDAPVNRYGSVQGMLSLIEGDQIEYLIDRETNEVLYIYNEGIKKDAKATGILKPLSGLSEGLITIEVKEGITFTYPMRSSLYHVENQTLRIGEVTYKVEQAPVGSQITLTLQNDIVTAIAYKGTEVIYSEISGIVKENNPDFSYITIIDWDGKEKTLNYEKSKLVVEKQNYYDMTSEIGYIDEIFPEYNFDTRDSSIKDIEIGDIVHMRMDPNNSGYISLLSAKTNYIVRYGNIQQVQYKGAEGSNIVVQFEDSSIGNYDVSSNIPILKGNKNVGLGALLPGDIVRLLINQGVIEPGNVVETVKEMIIDVYGNNVANIYKGELGNSDKTQGTVNLYNTYQLSQLGWTDHSSAKALDISNSNIQYFDEAKPISLDYAQKYLSSDDVQAYVVTTEYYGKEKVEKITFRRGRDSVISPTNITYSNGQDQMNLLSEAGSIKLDEGTIVIKNGKLVQAGNVIAPDYAQVIVAGQGKAAIINIKAEPNNDALTIMRGRIKSIEDGNSFKVASHASLLDMAYIYSPIPREFIIDHNTRIIGEEGPVSLSEFIDYSEFSKVDEVYTIIAEGTKAKYLVQNEYATQGVKGQIYQVNGSEVMIKDVMVYNSNTKKWTSLSLTNNYGQINLLENSVIIKENKVVLMDELEDGDKLRVMTTDNLSLKLLLQSDRAIDGVILFVEK